ncbi:MAG: hypothetical protein KDE58_27925 [Caldilineaceae bacterium]|nr:hypothetical protein [Caldilineaceae bacterium]
MEISTGNISFFISQDYLSNFVMGVILVGLGAFFYIKRRENWAIWKKIFDEAKPSFTTGPSAIDKTVMGFGGLMAANVYGLLTLLFLSLGVDQLLFMGQLWTRIDGWIRGQLSLF